jgi:hypothetical protein
MIKLPSLGCVLPPSGTTIMSSAALITGPTGESGAGVSVIVVCPESGHSAPYTMEPAVETLRPARNVFPLTTTSKTLQLLALAARLSWK